MKTTRPKSQTGGDVRSAATRTARLAIIAPPSAASGAAMNIDAQGRVRVDRSAAAMTPTPLRAPGMPLDVFRPDLYTKLPMGPPRWLLPDSPQSCRRCVRQGLNLEPHRQPAGGSIRLRHGRTTRAATPCCRFRVRRGPGRLMLWALPSRDSGGFSTAPPVGRPRGRYPKSGLVGCCIRRTTRPGACLGQTRP